MDWIESLKPKDKAIMESRHGASIVNVLRTTKTMVIVGYYSDKRIIEFRFRKSNGYEINSDIWSRRHLSEWSQEKEDKIKEIAMRSRIIDKIRGRTYWTQLPTSDLVKIHDIINSHMAFSTD